MVTSNNASEDVSVMALMALSRAAAEVDMVEFSSLSFCFFFSGSGAIMTVCVMDRREEKTEKSFTKSFDVFLCIFFPCLLLIKCQR